VAERMTLEELLAQVKRKAGLVQDYTCIAEGFSSSGEKEGHRTTEYRFKRDPEMVYGKVVGNRSNYRSRSAPGSKFALRGGKLEARLGGILGFIKMSARPDDKIARWLRGERVDQSHIVFVIDALDKAAKAGRVTLEESEMVDGRLAYVLKTTGIDPKANCGVSEERVWLDQVTLLPLKIAKFEAGKAKAVSSWTIRNMKVNVGLTKKDFQI
jgi:hypothetical protein